MHDYRLYLYESNRSTHITGVIEFHADGDLAAMCEAERSARWQIRELWTGARRVCRLSAAELK